METGLKRALPIRMGLVFAAGFACALLTVLLAGADLIQDSPGPYQVSASSADGGVFVLDTRTGHLWQWTGEVWRPLGPPKEPAYESGPLSR
jgi:hypothetical protein